MMNLTNLVRKYETVLTLKKTSGSYIKGKWTESHIEKQFLGTALPLTPKELRYFEAGTYTLQDRKLYVPEDLKDLDGNDLVIETGDYIVKDQIEYKVEQATEAPEAANYKKFICKKKVEDNA